jgi:biotin-dependent carboxylase-like uncharacterized protein
VTFEVIDGGLVTTIQDLGRPGYGAYGVPEGGAMDRGAHGRANALAGNPPGAATLEFTLRGPRLRWGGRMPVRCGLAGDEEREILVKPGGVVDCGVLERAARGYFAAAGGFYARPVLGSASTLLVGGFGGFLGRPLKAQDKVDLVSGRRQKGGGRPQPRADASPPPPRALPAAGTAWTLRVLPAADSMPAGLIGAEWTAVEGDRVGVRLRGTGLSAPPVGPSLPMCAGCVQVTRGGQPILLLRDHPTVGGYAVAAVVIQADLDLAGQLRPGATVRFVEVTEAEAIAAL